MITHQLIRQLRKRFGDKATKQYLRQYFANKRNPVKPEERRLEFARFFFPEAFNEASPQFHIELFGMYAEQINFAAAAPRGHAKTTCSSVEVIYRIVNGFTHFTLVVSDTYTQARDIVDNIKSELEANRWLIWVYGDLRTEWHWTSGSFTTTNDVRVVARGSNMKVRGLKFRHWRPDFAVGDDLENDEAVQNPERRTKLLNWIKKALMPAMARKGSQIAIVGTVLHDDSLLNNMLKGLEGFAGWMKKRWAALINESTSLWPSMFPAEELKRMRDDPNYEKYLGPIVFAQEMQNEAIDDQSRIFKREWIYGLESNPTIYSLTALEERWAAEHPPDSVTWWKSTMRSIIMAVDPAISEKTTADYFAMVVIGIDAKGEIWILDLFRAQIGDIDEQVKKILEFNEQWKPDRIRIESVAYQAGLARAVQKQAAATGRHAPVFQVTPDKDKFRRAVIHSANFAGHLVHVRSDHPLFDAFVKELLDFPMGKNDDMLDAYMHAAEDTVKRFKARTFAEKPQGF